MDNTPTQADDSTQTAGFPKQFYSDQEVNDPQFSYPNQMNSGVARGTQRISNTDGSYIIIGAIPDGSGQFGIAYYNRQGKLIAKDNGVTTYKYDSTGRNYYQNGLLPDGSYGEVIAKSPYNVADAVV